MSDWLGLFVVCLKSSEIKRRQADEDLHNVAITRLLSQIYKKITHNSAFDWQLSPAHKRPGQRRM